MDHLAQAQQLTTEFPAYTETCSNESLAQMALAHAVIALVERLDRMTVLRSGLAMLRILEYTNKLPSED